MRSVIILCVNVLFFVFVGSSAQALNSQEFNVPLDKDVVITKESNFGTRYIRFEISLDGAAVEKFYDLDTTGGRVVWGLTERTLYPSLTPQIVSTIYSKARWLTAQEKEELKEYIKPRVVVPNNPACDSGGAVIKMKNVSTGEFETIYEFTTECGEVDLYKFSDAFSMNTIRAAFRLIMNLRFYE